jgi:hypothetical protein
MVNQQQVQTINNWFQQHGVSANLPCPACNGTTWTPTDIISTGLSPQRGAVQMGNAGPRMLRRVCNNCAFVMLFDANAIGI